MTTIQIIQKKYSSKIDPLDLDLLISAATGKSREFVLAHPEHKILITQNLKLETLIKRRLKNEPIAYILGRKEFFGLDFKVNKHTLVPRPETELLVELVLTESKVKSLPEVLCISKRAGQKSKTLIIDIGTGSGNIIISLAKKIKDDGLPMTDYSFFGIDISKKALAVAKQNAKKHKLDKKIKFLHGNLLEPIIDKKILIENHCSLIIVANLPYLSKKIYSKTPTNVKKYEPRSALFSNKGGLAHYEKLFRQIKKLSLFIVHCSLFIEISPEQKKPISLLIKKYFSKAKPIFHKDLTGRWRVCEIEI